MGLTFSEMDSIQKFNVTYLVTSLQRNTQRFLKQQIPCPHLSEDTTTKTTIDLIQKDACKIHGMEQ